MSRYRIASRKKYIVKRRKKNKERKELDPRTLRDIMRYTVKLNGDINFTLKMVNTSIM
jgi:hypothetical protein